MRLFVFILTLILGTLLTSLAHAQYRTNNQKRQSNINYLYSGGYKNEVGASTTYSEVSSADGMTNFRLSGSYKYMIARSIQLGGILEAAIMSGNGQSETLTGIIGTLTYNFNNSWNINDSFFVELGVGTSNTRLTNSAAQSENAFTYLLKFGKHIPLFDKIRYTPKLGFRKVGDLDMAFVLIPLNLTITY